MNEGQALSATFFAMGGHGVYVWSAYGFSLLVLVANLLLPWQQRQRLLRLIKRKNQQVTQQPRHEVQQ